MTTEVLVAGGAGFLGSHLCALLLRENEFDKVVCVDNLQTGSIANLQRLQSNPNFKFCEGDVKDEIVSEAN